MHLEHSRKKKRDRIATTILTLEPELSSVFFVSKMSNLEPREEGSSYRGANLVKLTR